jgi:hypothetical protein
LPLARNHREIEGVLEPGGHRSEPNDRFDFLGDGRFDRVGAQARSGEVQKWRKIHYLRLTDDCVAESDLTLGSP